MQVSKNARQYAINGIVQVQNVLQHIEMRFFPGYIIRRLNRQQFLRFKMKFDENDDTLIYPYIYCQHDSPVFGCRYLFRILKKGPTRKPICVSDIEGKHIMKPSEGVRGQSISIMDILNEENNLLDENGRLIIEYGIHIESFRAKNGIWNFSFVDPLFRPLHRHELVIDMDEKVYFVHKQLLSFHSPCYDFKIPKSERIKPEFALFRGRNINNCYQIAHGARMQSPVNDLFEIVVFAQSHFLSNVVRYCETKLIESSSGKKFRDARICNIFEFAIEKDLNHLLAELLRQYKIPKVVWKTVINGKMSGESMKLIMSRLLFS